jgi:hypothetical protein
MRFGGGLSVLDYAIGGSNISLRSFCRLGSTVSVLERSNLSKSCSLL